MNGTQLYQLRKLWVIVVLTLSGVLVTAGRVVRAQQIVPDGSLGAEGSIVTTVAPQVEQIDGGAMRDSNLFHSFEEFSINEGWTANFANPAGIENILSRVTGNSGSDIYGTLGVLGDANLFLLNPNGIIFGPNAELNINGSFYASTADSFLFPDGGEFSAVNPGDAGLLSVSVPLGVQYGPGASGAIANQGVLSAGQDFTLSGGSVDSSGVLSAPAGELRVEGVAGDVQISDASAQTATFSASNNLILQDSQLQTVADLNLLAGNMVQMWDSVENPLIAYAGGNLTVQGNQTVDIFGLNHPSSGLVSGGDMVLRSANAVGGDAYYWTGGNFRIEQLDGDLGDLFSPYDPVIHASGDVEFDSYTGASLHIFAGGSVTITGAVEIDSADQDFGRPSEEVFRLSDREDRLSMEDEDRRVAVDGRNRPTLDIRAGTNEFEFTTPGIELEIRPDQQGIEPPIMPKPESSSNIRVGSIQVARFIPAPDAPDDPDDLLVAQVFLTNQYEANQSLPGGNIEVTNGIQAPGGSVVIDSRGDIRIQGEVITGVFDGNGDVEEDTLAGSIYLLAVDNIQIGNPEANISKINAVSNNDDDFSTIEIFSSQGSVFINNAALTTSNLDPGGFAGDIIIFANNGEIKITDQRNRDDILENPTISSEGDQGRILLFGREIAVKDSLLSNSNFVPGEEDEITDSREIGIVATERFSLDNSTLNSSAVKRGDAGDIIINAVEEVVLDNSSRILTNVIGAGDESGNVEIITRSLAVTNGSSIEAVSESQGESKAGNIAIIADIVHLDRGRLTTNSDRETGGNIFLLSLNVSRRNLNSIEDLPGIDPGIDEETFLIIMRDNSEISAQSFSGSAESNGGNVTINILSNEENTPLVGLEDNGLTTSFFNNIEITGPNGVNQIRRNNRDLQEGFILADRSNNDILATAVEGNGGNIILNVDRIFGLEERNPPNDSTSDLSASSQFGAPGDVLVFDLDIDPTRGLGDLPLDLTNVSELVAEGCIGTDRSGVDTQGEFTRTGRGGLSPDPTGVLTDDALLDQSTPSTPADQSGSDSSAIPDPSNQQLVEAQGLARNASGKVSLVTNAAASPVSPTVFVPPTCDAT